MISLVVKAAAVAAGITIAWAYFKSPSPKNQIQIQRCEYCSENFYEYEGSQRWLICQSIYVCKRCAQIERCNDEF